MSKDNGNGSSDDSALRKIRDRIKRAQDKGEREEQATFWRTHKARETARARRARKEKK